jgi:hypothetical protein
MKKRTIGQVITIALVLLFTYTSLNKIFDYPGFQSQLVSSEMGRILFRFAWLIPLSELAIICLLIINRWRAVGLYASCLFLVAATVYIVIGLRSEVDLECACGGFLDQMPKPAHIIFNLLFAVAAAVAITLENSIQCIKIFHKHPGKENGT